MSINAQITSRSGQAGTRDAPTVVHGEFPIKSGRLGREFTQHLADVLQAAEFVARDGKVTEVSILVFDRALVPTEH